MKIIGINGSPRKGWNTHLLVEEALKGAASKGAETELVHLYDMRFRGCISCFACKKKENSGHCAFADELLPVLGRVGRCDGLILGSPIYISEVTASMRAFIERLTFQYVTYRKEGGSFIDRRIPVLSIYTMNVSEAQMKRIGYEEKFAFYEGRYNQLLGGPAKTLVSTETLQTDEYEKYEMSMFDAAARKKRRAEVFPLDLKKAFEMGAGLGSA
ncbi:flavodoxin [Spirochaetia bacterium]|nr:flavodoxin [Spirochaetia bacterium]